MPCFLSGIHTCFVCKKRSEDVRRCMIPVCGKFYHGECIANFAPTAPVNRGFRCSIHVCLTCFIANPNSSTISKGKPEHAGGTRGTLCTFHSCYRVYPQVGWCGACAVRSPIMPQTSAWPQAALFSPTTALSVPTTSVLVVVSRTMSTSMSAGALSALKVKSQAKTDDKVLIKFISCSFCKPEAKTG